MSEEGDKGRHLISEHGWVVALIGIGIALWGAGSWMEQLRGKVDWVGGVTALIGFGKWLLQQSRKKTREEVALAVEEKNSFALITLGAELKRQDRKSNRRHRANIKAMGDIRKTFLSRNEQTAQRLADHDRQIEEVNKKVDQIAEDVKGLKGPKTGG
ncbi:MAG TPA: hypothetical protein VHC22_32570 [Pirellulales bacterium]|nr:hypothetical protein [Pirellulales bacterium]